ncbi:MAG TPA: hypothetical protein VHV27_07330 [Phenylobacterium sp.]|jgi:ABC-2 type transport system permease protein|nr:hypothetical protein [Phenylobacterium sp.]
MSAETETLTPRRVRPFYWSLRRELWENRSTYLAPLVVAAVVLGGYLFALRFLTPMAHLAAGVVDGVGAKVGGKLTTAGKAELAIVTPYNIAVGALLITALIVGAFYALGALHGERRDRSILFWKSLPVSDLTAVLAKAFLPLIIIPLVAAAVAILTQAVMLGCGMAALMASGADPSLLSRHLHLDVMWVTPPYGFLAASIWYAPILGWLLLVSAWAKRMTFVWAVAPPAAICLFERLAFGTAHAWELLGRRLQGGLAQAFTSGGKGGGEIEHLSQLDPLGFVANPEMWAGLAVFAACLAGCVWLRRRRDPI